MTNWLQLKYITVVAPTDLRFCIKQKHKRASSCLQNQKRIWFVFFYADIRDSGFVFYVKIDLYFYSYVYKFKKIYKFNEDFRVNIIYLPNYQLVHMFCRSKVFENAEINNITETIMFIEISRECIFYFFIVTGEGWHLQQLAGILFSFRSG